MAINSEKLYDLACDNVKQMLLADGEKFEEVEHAFAIITKDENIRGVMNMNPRLAPALEIYLMAKDELGKAKGGTAYSAFKRIIRRIPDHRKSLQGVWTDSEGRSCVCDGYLSIRLKKPMEGFESVPGMDLEKVFPNSTYFTDPVDVEIPTPGELKIKKRKLGSWRGAQTVYDFGEDLPMVDASFLKDVMDCLPDAKAVTERNSTTRLIYFTSDRGDAILLPVRKKDVA